MRRLQRIKIVDRRITKIGEGLVQVNYDGFDLSQIPDATNEDGAHEGSSTHVLTLYMRLQLISVAMLTARQI